MPPYPRAQKEATNTRPREVAIDPLAPLRSETAHYRYLLLLRFTLFNLGAFALAGAALAEGLVGQILTADTSGISAGIMILFAFGLAICASKVWRVSVELNAVRAFDPHRHSWAAQYLSEIRNRDAGSRAIVGEALRTKLASRIAVVRQVAGCLVILGLIGTVAGFIVALAGVDPNKAADVATISPMVSRLIHGMSIALYTTLVGAILNVWLMVDYHMLQGGVVRLATALMSLGEAKAHA